MMRSASPAQHVEEVTFTAPIRSLNNGKESPG
jgi:hypothetical protein